MRNLKKNALLSGQKKIRTDEMSIKKSMKNISPRQSQRSNTKKAYSGDIIDMNTENLPTPQGQQSHSQKHSGMSLQQRNSLESVNAQNLATTETINAAKGKPSVSAIRSVLWETILQLRAGTIEPEIAKTISAGANAITRNARLEWDILSRNKTINSEILGVTVDVAPEGNKY
jgi:hypothetical protein